MHSPTGVNAPITPPWPSLLAVLRAEVLLVGHVPQGVGLEEGVTARCTEGGSTPG